MSAENQNFSGEPDQNKPIIDPSQYVPTLDRLVVNPDELIGIVQSPDQEVLRVCEIAALSGVDLGHDATLDQVDLIRRNALTNIVTPEAEAQLVRSSEAKTHSALENNCVVIAGELRGAVVGPDARKQDQVLSDLNDHMRLALTAVDELHSLLNAKSSARDRSMVESKLNQIKGFVDKYRPVRPMLMTGQMREISAVTQAGVTHAELSKALDQIESDYYAAKEEISEKPAKALTAHTVEAIAARDAHSAAEHQASCEDEISQSEKRQREIKDTSSDIKEQIILAGSNLEIGKSYLEDLTDPDRLAQAVYDLERFISSSQDGSEQSVRYAVISVAEVRRLLSDMRNRLTDTGKDNLKAKLLATEAIESLYDLSEPA